MERLRSQERTRDILMNKITSTILQKPTKTRDMVDQKFKINTDKSVLDKEIKLYFDKNYKEYRSNEFWDRLMSV